MIYDTYEEKLTDVTVFDTTGLTAAFEFTYDEVKEYLKYFPD